jgi:hypothetical protein
MLVPQHGSELAYGVGPPKGAPTMGQDSPAPQRVSQGSGEGHGRSLDSETKPRRTARTPESRQAVARRVTRQRVGSWLQVFLGLRGDQEPGSRELPEEMATEQHGTRSNDHQSHRDDPLEPGVPTTHGTDSVGQRELWLPLGEHGQLGHEEGSQGEHEPRQPVPPEAVPGCVYVSLSDHAPDARGASLTGQNRWGSTHTGGRLSSLTKHGAGGKDE